MINTRFLVVVLPIATFIGGFYFANSRRPNTTKAEVITTVEIKKIDSVVASQNLKEYAPLQGGDVYSVVDDLPHTWWYAPVNLQTSTSIELKLKKPEVVSSIGLSFMDRYAVAFAIYMKHEDDWVLVKEVTDNQSESAKVRIDDEYQIKTTAVKIVFYKTVASDNLVSVREVKLFKPRISLETQK